ncbi:MAG: bifunctional phosphopantothenoylcysteine decarboxylase/phosphopantothenate--cysteine ligase CoaBC, partial [Anaerolineae bacterium]
ANLAILRGRGVQILEPEVGRFASGLVGQGRLPETPTLMGFIRRTLAQNGPLARRRVVVTAGGTKEPLDPVRYITNRSSGRQGYAVAQAALDAGAEVTLVSTVEHLPIPTGATRVKVSSASEMLEAVLQAATSADVLIMAAAVADFRPAVVATQKIKKSDDNQTGITLELARTEDILLAVKTLRQQSGYPRCVVGFAAESHDLLTNAASKLERKGLDFIVANDITAPGAGFEVETNRITILDAAGGRSNYDLLSKTEVGQVIVERVREMLTDKTS